ncbi:putative motility protein [Salibacterium salarium]|uniref:Putative motility protein n=1 Tax=Salibacterium salarium TaxID=284579 RepID=A0A428MV11_9BACI|nr:YjfB family protein [Salibacterium salarium]RSL29969.1 putative motility protein [Salibacterium salarium]
MDIGAMSMAHSQGQAKQQASLSIMNKAMDTGEQQGEFVNNMLESSQPQQAAHPSKGSSVDVSI